MKPAGLCLIGRRVELRPKRVMFVITGLDYGGAETQVVNLAIRLRARGWEVSIVSMLSPEAYAQELESAQIPLWTLNMHRGVANPLALLRAAALIRKWRPQIVHSHMVHANLFARVVRLAGWFPVQISTAHSTDEGGRVRELVYRLTDPLCDLTTNVSNAAVERYIRVGAVPKRKIRFMPNGVDAGKFAPNSVARAKKRGELGLSSQFVWLAVGRFDPVKDHETMIRAFSLADAKFPGISLLLAGQGPLESAAKELALGLTESGRVRFLGVRQDVADLMAAADGYLMSSRWEGMPMVLLEAQSAGLPVVATDVGGNKEVVLNGRTGFLVPPGDAAALAASMEKTMSLSAKERELMGQVARRHVEECFGMDRVVDLWEDLYERLLMGRTSRRAFAANASRKN